MTPIAGTDYLETEVMTASPQRLQLMLIDAAVRSASQARQFLAQQDKQAALAPNLRAQRIMAELLSGLKPEPESQDGLVGRVASVYLFIYRSLIAANAEHSTARLDDALRVLEIERETWRQVCEQLGAEHHESEAGSALSLGTSFEA
ncbi:MAG TPA: flagellar export chaperone FliS [Pirellulales bacterium]|jgi:flagellar protein FliS|nr:flagellar export chaperone FliS [Pirellulales bacterium]